MYSLRCKLPNGTSSTSVCTVSTLAQPGADFLCQRGPGGCLARELHPDGERRLLLHTRRLRPDEYVAAHLGRETTHDLTHGRGKDVDTAHDQHVVGAPDAPQARAGAAAAAGARPHRDVVAGAKAHERRGVVLKMREHELALGTVLQRDRPARLRLDQLGVNEAARAEMHAVLLLALTPE